MQPIVFLSTDDVLQIHRDTMEREGGLDGVRDAGLLEAAVAMPRQRYGGELLHPDLASIAAAYLFHLAMNHAFHDGNKRVAAMSALVLLDVNDIETLPAPKALETLTLAVASSEMSKPELTQWFRDQLSESA